MPDTSQRVVRIFISSPGDVAEEREGARHVIEGLQRFYLNATQSPWNTHYRMYAYIVDELPALLDAGFPVDSARAGIFGHSMGGHGALTIALKNPGRFRSV